jgi:hypothetical protein
LPATLTVSEIISAADGGPIRSQEALELPLALRRDMPTLQQGGAELIDQSRPLADQPISRPMERLNVELILTFHVDEPHRRTGGRFGDPFSVAIVVLLRLGIGSDIFWRHQRYVVAMSGEHTTEMVGAPGGIISLQGGGIIQESLGAIIPLQTGGFVGIGSASPELFEFGN